MKVVWTPEAKAQLETVLRHVGREDFEAAMNWSAKLQAALANLAEFPESGRIHPDYGDEFVREIIVGHYRVAYLSKPGRLEILSIWHGARRVPGRGIAGELSDE